MVAHDTFSMLWTKRELIKPKSNACPKVLRIRNDTQKSTFELLKRISPPGSRSASNSRTRAEAVSFLGQFRGGPVHAAFCGNLPYLHHVGMKVHEHIFRLIDACQILCRTAVKALFKLPEFLTSSDGGQNKHGRSYKWAFRHCDEVPQRRPVFKYRPFVNNILRWLDAGESDVSLNERSSERLAVMPETV